MKTDNELIAEFMGLDVDGGNVTDGTLETTVEKLQYHTSWDWIMPVVEKIEELPNVYSVEIHMGATVQIHSGILFEYFWDGIKSVHKAVVEFIKWHNDQKG